MISSGERHITNTLKDDITEKKEQRNFPRRPINLCCSHLYLVWIDLFQLRMRCHVGADESDLRLARLVCGDHTLVNKANS